MPETSPELSPRCLKCGSDAVIPDVRLIDRREGNARMPAELGVETKPDALMFTGEVRVSTRAQVCGDCGFVEVYAADPRTLWDAYVERLAREFDR